MKCIIIDDEEMARVVTAQIISNNQQLKLLQEFPNAIQAIKYLNQNDIDLIFLDVHMPVFNGFDFIQTLKNPPKIILITSDKNFAFEAFEYDCVVDFLVKPITQERFDKSIQKVISINKSASKNKNTISYTDTKVNELYVNIDRRLIKIDFNSITVIQAKGDYIHIKTDAQNYIVHSTLKKIEDKLPKDLFLKVHRSFIINIKKIIDIEDNSLLISKDIIPVSRSNKSELIERLNLL